MPADRPFPRNLIEFQRRFGTEEACDAHLADLRWPDGFRCPRCGGERAYRIAARRVHECASCGHQASTTAGTVLHRTRTDLTLWFLAAFLMVTDKRGLSALSLQRQVGVKRYETAWMMLHKLRRATVNANRTRLAGTVEVDEAWIGGEQKGLPGGRTRAGRAAALAVFAVEIRDERPQRLRIKLVPDDTAASLVGFIEEVAEPGSTIITDGWRGYSPLPRHGFVHQRVVSGKGDKFVNPVPHTHVAIGNLKSWLIGTHKGVWKRHLAAYLDEFVFRYNRRRDLALAFRTLLGYGATREPTTYATIRGASDLPKIVYTPSRSERGRARRPSSRRAPEPQDTPAAPVAQDGMDPVSRESVGHLPNGPIRGGGARPLMRRVWERSLWESRPSCWGGNEVGGCGMIRRRLATLAVGLVMLAAPSAVSAHSPRVGSVAPADAHAQVVPIGDQYSPQAWAQIKASLNSSSLVREVTVADGVRTFTYSLPSGSTIVLEEPVGPQSVVTPQWSVGGCGFLRVCVWLNRGDQMIVMAGSFGALAAAICIATAGIACIVVSGALAAAAVALQQRGYICPNYMVVELAFSPGTLRGCY